MKDSTFEKMKGIEEKKNKAQILRILTALKDNARMVQENKEMCNLYLEEVCKDEKEKKQIIDWINSLDDVKLSEDRTKDLREQVKENIKKEKAKIDRQFDETPELIYSNYTAGTGAISSRTGLLSGTTCTNNTAAVCTVGGYSLSNNANSLALN